MVALRTVHLSSFTQLPRPSVGAQSNEQHHQTCMYVTRCARNFRPVSSSIEHVLGPDTLVGLRYRLRALSGWLCAVGSGGGKLHGRGGSRCSTVDGESTVISILPYRKLYLAFPATRRAPDRSASVTS